MDALDAFPSLIETRLTGNPVVETNPHTRHEVVARVQRLGMLNGSLVGHAERRDAEIRYLRRALDEASTATAADATAAVAERHPRMAQLLVRTLRTAALVRAFAEQRALRKRRRRSESLRQAAAPALLPSAAPVWRTTCCR